MVNKYEVVGFGTGLVLSPAVDFVGGATIWALSKSKNSKSFAKGMAVAGAVEVGLIVVLVAVLVTQQPPIVGLGNPLIFK